MSTHEGVPVVCEACGLPGLSWNPLKDYVHDQDRCMIYLPSGSCTCERPGYLAHALRCPIPVVGDMAPMAPEVPGERRIA